MGGGTSDGEVINSQLKNFFGLEYVIDLERREFKSKRIGFSKDRFIILEIDGVKCNHTQISIGTSLYELFKDQALKGDFRSIKEFYKQLITPIEKVY